VREPARTISARRAVAKQKIVDFYRESREMQREGPAYFVFFAILMIVAFPFLMLEASVYLLAGRDMGWFPVSRKDTQADAVLITTAELIAKMDSLKQAALHLVGTSRDVRSRIGGAPDLPDDFEWPRWKNAPLAFLAQIDLAEIGTQSVFPELPDYGLLHVFYDQEQSTWGFDPDDKGSWRVYYCDDVVRLRRTDPPAGVSQHGRYREKRIEFREIATYPSLDRLSDEPMQMSDETWDEMDIFLSRDFAGLSRHQIGGLPHPVQGDNMELECQLASNGVNVGGPDGFSSPEAKALESGAADWVLLLQLDSDDETDMMWGDVGVLYFWIRKEDLRARKFSECWMVLQCC